MRFLQKPVKYNVTLVDEFLKPLKYLLIVSNVKIDYIPIYKCSFVTVSLESFPFFMKVGLQLFENTLNQWCSIFLLIKLLLKILPFRLQTNIVVIPQNRHKHF